MVIRYTNIASSKSNARLYEAIRPHHLVIGYGIWKLVIILLPEATSDAVTSKINKLSIKLLSVVSDAVEKYGLILVHKGLVPDFIIRAGIRFQLVSHLRLLGAESAVVELEKKLQIVEQLKTMPIAIETQKANEQHYEVPAEFYNYCLGPCKKYSSGYFPSPTTTFAESELAMLDLYCQRAGVQDGMTIVDLGCGWGSLSLYLLEHYPNCKITAISNSQSQRQYIYATAHERQLKLENLTIITCNVANDNGALNIVKDNDLVMTVEMFEHMKNYKQLLEKIHGFLKPQGKLFVHIFTHKDYAYHFEEGWMSETFFTGGTMPSDDLLLYFCQDFFIQKHWRVNGTHYEKTSNCWLETLDKSWRDNRNELSAVLGEAYGVGNEHDWYINWRLFFLACAELWGLRNGEEWIVSHYLFERR